MPGSCTCGIELKSPGHSEERKEESCLMSINKPTVDKSQLAGTDTLDRGNTNAKLESLEQFRSDATEQALRTNQGVKIADNQNTLRAGPRGPSLLEDFIMREKITHFDHERIPERIVHARGTGAHGY